MCHALYFVVIVTNTANSQHLPVVCIAEHRHMYTLTL